MPLYNPAPGPVIGSATNDNAAAGNVGEFISSSIAQGSAVALTTATPANVTSISLTPGDWDVWGNIAYNPAGTTNITNLIGFISTVGATLPSAPNGGAQFFVNFPGGVVPVSNLVYPIGLTRLSLNALTTVFLEAYSTFTVSTNAAYGFIGARRAR